MAEIDHVNVKLLYEGLNESGEYRLIYYMPWTDGFAILFVTDADGNRTNSYRIQDISNWHTPEEYWPDLPISFKPPQVDYNNR